MSIPTLVQEVKKFCESYLFERQANTQDIRFAVVLCRRNEDKVELTPGASRQPADAL